MTTIVRITLWAARITGSILLFFLLFMLIGHLTGNANGPNGMVFHGGSEVLAFILFPVSTSVGLLVAYKWPVLGGCVATASLLLLFLLRTDLLQFTFLAMAIPGALYVIHGLLQRRNTAHA